MYINSVQKMKFSNININKVKLFIEVLMCNSYKISAGLRFLVPFFEVRISY